MFDRIEDVFVATTESGRGWSFELVVAGRDEGDDETFDTVIEFGGGFRSREAAQLAGEQVMGEYMAGLDADTLERIKGNRRD